MYEKLGPFYFVRYFVELIFRTFHQSGHFHRYFQSVQPVLYHLPVWLLWCDNDFYFLFFSKQKITFQ